ncbi:MAG: pyridoxamine 5'-phosphate oxidase family protein [Anaerolineales bacterium]|nr:pyridoxamine 5'-phosphate oxidase family protein [Anaerolineales bacterium]
MITAEVKASARESVLCWLATANASGEPNVSPKEMFVVEGDDRLLIANIASPTSVRNILQNTAVSVSFIHVFKEKGYKLKGRARIILPTDPAYGTKVAPLLKMTGDRFPIKSVIEVTVTAVSAIIAPSYWLYPDETTEAGKMVQAMQTYGVAPGGEIK